MGVSSSVGGGQSALGEGSSPAPFREEERGTEQARNLHVGHFGHHPGVRAGGVDWITAFRDMQQAVTAAAPRRPAADRWEHRAERFDRACREKSGADELPAALADLLRDGDVVVDIGAGTGRHTVPFARRCRRVLAVEPSPAMRVRLERRVQEEALSNVDVVDAVWPAPGAPRGDVVFSSHVLYGVDDAVAFLEGMSAAARRVCALYLGVSAPRDRGTLPRWPAALEALGLLYQMGIHASLTPLAEPPRRLGAEEPNVLVWWLTR